LSVRDTSLEVYFTKVLPHLSNKQQQVYAVYKRWRDCDFTDAELSQELGWSINRVTPRTGELRKKGLIVELPRRVCKVTGNLAHPKKLCQWGDTSR
jgi:hypothetical protein